MKILAVHNYYRFRGGEDDAFDAEVSLLKKRGHQVLVYSRRNEETEKFGFVGKALFPFAAFFNLRTVSDLRKACGLFKPDLTHVHNTFPLISGAAYLYLRLKGIPVIQTAHNFRFICANGLFFTDGRPCERCLMPSLYPVMKRCYRKSALLSLLYCGIIFFYRFTGLYSLCIRTFICVSAFVKEKMIAAGYPKGKMAVKGYFTAPADDKVKEPSGEKDYCLYLGRLSDEKGIATLLKAFRKVKNFKLKIAGSGPLEREVALASGGSIEYLGFVRGAEKEALIGGARFLAFPSQCYETFGKAVIEAAILRVPSVVSNIGALRELVKDGFTGLLFEPGDADDLEKKIEFFKDHPEECRRMGANAYREAADNYNEEKNYRELLAVYEGALEMKPDSPETDRRQSRYVIGMRVDYTTYSKAAAKIVNLARSAKGAYVCVATAHMAVMTHRDLAFREVVNGADLVTPDGMPLVWELKARGVKNAERVRGLNLTMEVCKRAEESGLPVGLYGGLDGDVLRLVCEKLKKAFPRLVIVYAKAPPFSEAVTVDEETVREMIRSGARIIFVGLGCPKQETWMALHKERLPAVTLGVGAAFDFIAGVKREAPLWMQRMGLEWLFRLMQEPRRLWKRYVIGNAQFLFYHLKG